MALSRKQLALIHVAKRELGLDDDLYRSFLNGFGVESSKDLTQGQFERVLDALQKMGFQHIKNEKKAPANKRPLLSKIKAMLDSLDLPWKYADGCAKRMFNVDLALWCEPAQLRGIVAALVRHKQRIEKKKMSTKDTKEDTKGHEEKT